MYRFYDDVFLFVFEYRKSAWIFNIREISGCKLDVKMVFLRGYFWKFFLNKIFHEKTNEKQKKMVQFTGTTIFGLIDYVFFLVIQRRIVEI